MRGRVTYNSNERCDKNETKIIEFRPSLKS